MLLLQRFRKYESRAWRICVVSAAILSFFVAAIKPVSYSSHLEALFGITVNPDLVLQWKRLAFCYFCFPVLSLAVLRGTRPNTGLSYILKALPLTAAAFLLLTCFVSIHHYPTGIAGIGEWYYFPMTRNPFGYDIEYAFRRVLFPFLFHLTGLESTFAFRDFSIFFAGLTAVFVVSQLEPLLSRRGLAARLLFHLSFLSSSFFVQTLQLPGYPDGLLFLLVLVLCFYRSTSAARYALIALALITHDGAIFMLAPLLLARMRRGEAFRCITLMFTFYLIGVMDSGLEEPMTKHDVIGPTSAYLTIADKPGLYLSGFFLGYKLFWAPVIAILLSHRRRQYSTRLMILTAGPLAVLGIAWDTSRLAAFSLPGVLLCLMLFVKKLERTPRTLSRDSYLLLALLLNLLIPSRMVFMHVLHTHADYPIAGWYRDIFEGIRKTAPQPVNWFLTGY